VVAGECDGRAKYGAEDSAAWASRAESGQQHGLVEAGIDVVRRCATDIFAQPESVVTKVRGHRMARG
jgi:hypothetical protein